MLVLILACLPAMASSSASSDLITAVSSNKPKTINTTGSTSTSSESQTSVSPSAARPFQGVYVVSPHPFPEVEAFVATSTTDYNLDLDHYALPMRLALEAYLGEKTAVKADAL
jgi:FAD synthetase